MQRLPTLMFFENHGDPTTARILEKLLPKLIELGYEIFLDEMSDPNIASAKKWFEQKIDENRKAYESLKKSGLVFSDVSSKELTKKLSFLNSTMKKLVPNKVKDPAERIKIINRVVQLQRYEGYVANYSFYWELEKRADQIVFRGIDDDSKKEMKLRNQDMVKAHLSTVKPTVGRNGLNHLLEMQKEILQNKSFKSANQQFHSFYIYRNGAWLPFEEQIRSRQINPPLGLTMIDASKKSDEEVVDYIIKMIKEIYLCSDEVRFAKDQNFFFKGCKERESSMHAEGLAVLADVTQAQQLTEFKL